MIEKSYLSVISDNGNYPAAYCYATMMGAAGEPRVLFIHSAVVMATDGSDKRLAMRIDLIAKQLSYNMSGNNVDLNVIVNGDTGGIIMADKLSSMGNKVIRFREHDKPPKWADQARFVDRKAEGHLYFTEALAHNFIMGASSEDLQAFDRYLREVLSLNENGQWYVRGYDGTDQAALAYAAMAQIFVVDSAILIM